MNPSDLIQSLRGAFQDDKRLTALFLTGSYGNDTNDAYSDIDFLGICDPEHIADIGKAWQDHLSSLQPVIYENRIEGGFLLLNITLEDWTRCDLLLGDRNLLGGKAKDTMRPLIDRQDLYAGLPETIPHRGPNPVKLAYLIKEFIRVIGLMPVGHGRDEVIVATTGVGLLRSLLIDLMLETVPLNDKGGALHLRKLLKDEDLEKLQSLPQPEPNWPSITEASFAIADCFLPLARKLADEAAIEWPHDFERATDAHVKKMIGRGFLD